MRRCIECSCSRRFAQHIRFSAQIQSFGLTFAFADLYKIFAAFSMTALDYVGLINLDRLPQPQATKYKQTHTRDSARDGDGDGLERGMSEVCVYVMSQ